MPNTLTERAPKATAANTKKAPADPKPAPTNLAFSAAHAELSKAIDAAASVAREGVAQPALACLLIDATAGTLELAATDGEARFEAIITGKVVTPGRALIPAAPLAAALKVLPSNEDVSLVMDGFKATLKAGKTSYRLLCLDPDDYPTAEGWRNALGPCRARYVFAQHDAHRLLTAGAFALPRKDHRRVLLGTNLEATTALEIRATATDGKQLARVTAEAQATSAHAWEEKGARSVIVPRAMTDIARRHLSHTPPKKDQPPATCKLALHDNAARLDVPGLGAFSFLAIGGKYPDCDQVIPRDFAARVEFSVPALLAACKRAGVTSEDKTRTFVLHISNGLIRYESMSADLGTCEGEFPADYHGDPWTLGFNVDLLAEVLTVLGDVPARMNIKSVTQPVIFTADKAPDMLLLLMPVKQRDHTPAPAAEE